MYSSTLSSPSALDYVGSSTPRLGRFIPSSDRYPLCRRLGGPQGSSGRVQKTLSPPVFDPRTVPPVASCYTDCAIRAAFVHRHL
jgi:hypothetical protein